MKDNDITDFLLREYENIANAYFNAHDTTAKWFKYYLIMLASPFSFIVFIYHNNSDDFNLFNLSITISILILLIGILSMLVSLIIINSRIDATLYARTVNGIRKYFVDQDKINVHRNKRLDVEKYLVLPTDIAKPKFIKLEGDLFILFLFMAIINSSYIVIGLNKFIKIESTCCKAILLIIILLIVITFHIIYYIHITNKKEKTYAQKSDLIK